ncbi:MAG: inorganic phosphate transporter [Gammaproteobacteria bacterium]|nr:inorganic phosphate transporter [Gammaproteobacteria bacterium]NND53943.1 inorganic phosphate transporter [Gammaproteobacteria bacterium]
MDAYYIYVGLALAFGLFMAWGIGANDVANAMATSIGSGALTLKKALIVAGVFEFAGAVLAGGEVTSTIRKGMVDATLFADTPGILAIGMLSALLAAGTWLLIASIRGWPVSTTHSIVGAIVGFAVVAVGFAAVEWGKIGTIVLSWVISPLTSGVIAYGIFLSIKRLILVRKNPFKRAKRYAPFYVFVAVTLIVLVTMFKGLKHIGLTFTTLEAYSLALLLGAFVAWLSRIAISRIRIDDNARRQFQHKRVETVFAILMIFTACAMAFAHGSNDVANAIGPVAAVVSIATQGSVAQQAGLPIWILVVGGFGIVIGLGTYGRRVIKTVGSQITNLTPVRGFSAEIAAAFTIVVASGTGMPVSTTHTLIGAVLGVGLVKGTSAIDLVVVKGIFASWLVTVPAGALLSIVYFLLLRQVMPPL